jgi:Tol biopolymer transport system component
MRIHALIGAFGITAALASGCGSTSEPTARAAVQQADRVPAGRIVFRRFLDDAQTHGAIFTVNTDGTGTTQLTHPAAGIVDNYPDWSPGGRRVTFERCGPDQPCEVWTIAADGSDARRLHPRCDLKPECDASGPSWTPSGKLLFTLASGRVRKLGGSDQVERSALVEVDPENGKLRTILVSKPFAGDLIEPAAAPDGSALVYKRWNSQRVTPRGEAALFKVGMDGSGDHRLTPWALGGGDHATIAPDGTVLFRSYEDDDTRQSDFWTVNLDGSALRQLTHFHDGTIVRSASYSPDGAWIVHASNGVDGKADLYVMHADGTGNRVLIKAKPWDSAPDWAPDR